MSGRKTGQGEGFAATTSHGEDGVTVRTMNQGAGFAATTSNSEEA
jgi:hypothetical protein